MNIYILKFLPSIIKEVAWNEKSFEQCFSNVGVHHISHLVGLLKQNIDSVGVGWGSGMCADKFLRDAEAPGNDNSVNWAPTTCLFILGFFPILLIPLEYDEMKQNHTHKTLGEQNFILKIYLSNNEISKAGHCNKKEKEQFALHVFLKNTKLSLIYCQLSFVCIWIIHFMD